MYAWLPLYEIEPAIPWMERRGVSEVARSRRGFLARYQRIGGDPTLLGLTPKSTPNRKPYPWAQRRAEFIGRHMGQIRDRGESLWDASGDPTDHHLALIAWAYTPDRARWQRWLKRRTGSTVEKLSIGEIATIAIDFILPDPIPFTPGPATFAILAKNAAGG